MSSEFVFMDDNTRLHQAKHRKRCLQFHVITPIEWPTFSPDLNPTQHVWHRLSQRVSAFNHVLHMYRNFGEHCLQLKKCFAEGFELITSNCHSLKKVVSLNRKRQVGQIGETLVIWVEAMRPLEEAGKNGCKMADDSGRPRATVDREDRLIVRSAVTASDSSLSIIRRTTRTRVSTMTIHRWLIERNLRSYRSLHQMPFTPARFRARLQ
ncbi:hypothetical protein TNCV_3785781 [Trichonephila clavipes]|nr:hypothetical protein TNCV_3785781 [Trichonephila clavipes]